MTTTGSYFFGIGGQDNTRHNDQVETASQEVMHGDDHLSSSSEDDIEERQYEDESDTFRESQAPITLDDSDPTILIPQLTEDIDVLNPKAWANNMKNAER